MTEIDRRSFMAGAIIARTLSEVYGAGRRVSDTELVALVDDRLKLLGLEGVTTTEFDSVMDDTTLMMKRAGA